MDCRLAPLFTKIVVQRIDQEGRTLSGIYIPDVAQEKPHQGLVIEVGPGRHLDTGELIRCTVQRGDQVLFKKYAGDDISIDGENYVILEEEQLLCVLKPLETP